MCKAGRHLFDLEMHERISAIQNAYYHRKINELERKRSSLEKALAKAQYEASLVRLTELSMKWFRNHLAKAYHNRKRKKFSLAELKKEPEEFLAEYPLILSTTFSVITSLKNGYLFDCVIVDEASQVDLVTGMLALACAQKLVIVGDPKQLPNVLTPEDISRAKEVDEQFDVPDYVRFTQHNLISSLEQAIPDMPKTLLKEHYRCHPKIIEFCNQQFYAGELVVLTKDNGETDVLKAIVTVPGNHDRGHINQRQVEEIKTQILPKLENVPRAEIGIVSPYRKQVMLIATSKGTEDLKVDTVHKFQGQEKKVMIITTVANESNPFVDDPQLLNVAISRAQNKIRLVVAHEFAEGQGNISSFVRYIRYQNGEVAPGKVRSIFDLLYSQYTQTRLSVLKNRKHISKYPSENLAHILLEDVLMEAKYRRYSGIFQYPLSMLIQNDNALTEDEKKYAHHPWTQCDFMIYQKVDKHPVLIIEVDGYDNHKAGTPQYDRDRLKDSILSKIGLPILRLSTVGSNEYEVIKEKLDEIGR
jgi:AAA domain/Protein of unknown function (DUF2726)